MERSSEPRTPSSRTYGGASAVQRLDDRRQRLRAAVVSIVGRAGWAAATVRAVAAEAGIGPRFLYESYEDVHDLAQSTYDEVGAELISAAVAAFQRHTDVVAGTRASTEAMVEGLLADPVRARFFLSEAPGLVARRIALLTGTAEAYAELVSSTREDFQRIRRRAIFAAAGGLELVRIHLDREDDTLDAESIVDTVSQALLAA